MTQNGQESIYKHDPSHISDKVAYESIEIKNPIEKGIGKEIMFLDVVEEIFEKKELFGYSLAS